MKALLKLSEAAVILGLSRQTVYRGVVSGKIPCNTSLGPKSWRIPGWWLSWYISGGGDTSIDTAFQAQPSATKCNELRGGRRGKEAKK